MRFTLFTIITLLASPGIGAEPQSQRIAMSKTAVAEKTSPTAIDQNRDMLPVDDSIIIRSAGVDYSPITLAHQPLSTARKPGVYKGQSVRTLKGRQTGEITGTILVKTSNQNALLQSPQAIAIGNEFVLLSYGSETELLAELKRLQERADVESAELEVNTKRHKPR